MAMFLFPVVNEDNDDLPKAILYDPLAAALNATSPIEMLDATLLLPLPTLTLLIFK